MNRLVPTLGAIAAAVMLVACQSGNGAGASQQAKVVTKSPTSVVITSPTLAATPRTTTTPLLTSTAASRTPASNSATVKSSAPTNRALSNSSIEKIVCAIAFPNGVQGGHCHLPTLKVSKVDPNWVWARIGIYNHQDQLRSDEAEIIVNLVTRKAVGPTNVGFCGIDDPAATRPIDGYSSIPPDILIGLGLKPCASSAASGTGIRTTELTGPTAFKPFAGAWGAHETSLTVAANGTGELKYADLAGCPNCAQANAPVGTLVFVLRTVSNGVGVGSVTGTSDAKNWAVGDSVAVTVVPGSPGQLLKVTIAGKQLLPFCNVSSIGQCGA